MYQTESTLTRRVAEYVKEKTTGEGTGHDWYHLERVLRTARSLAKIEGGDIPTIELAVLTHDLGDPKLSNGDYSAVPRVARETLIARGAPIELADKVAAVVNEVSFKGPIEDTRPSSREACIVQDADRLDAIGALGISRAFAFGGKRGRPLHDPTQPPNLTMTKEDYYQRLGTTINHFYEKMLLVKDRLNTKSAKQLAEHRHKFMQEFLAEFLAEWEGKH